MTIALTNQEVSPTDMIRSTSNDQSGFAMYEMLYEFDANGALQPWLAEKTDVSADGLTWTLTLRTGVKFHDGTDFDAAAVKWNLDTRKGLATFGLKISLDPIRDIKVLDSKTVQFLLTRPAGSLRTALSGLAFAMQSPTAWAKYPDPLLYARNAAGTGPFKLESVSADASSYVRNDQYWGTKPYLDKVAYRAIPDPAARLAALESGQVQLIEGIPEPEVARITKENKFDLLKAGSQVTSPFMIFMNTATGPTADKRVRQAILYGLNREPYLAAYYGLATLADSVVGSGLLGYAPQTPYPYDVAKAKQMLADAGIQPGTPLNIIIYNQQHLAMTELVKQDLDRLGFQTTITQVQQPAWLTALNAPGPQSTWNLTINAVGIAYNDAEAPLTRLFQSTNDAPKGQNWTHYKSPQVDALLAQQATTSDPATRQGLLAQIQKIINDDVPMYGLVNDPTLYGVAKSVHGVSLRVAGFLLWFGSAWIDG